MVTNVRIVPVRECLSFRRFEAIVPVNPAQSAENAHSTPFHAPRWQLGQSWMASREIAAREFVSATWPDYREEKDVFVSQTDLSHTAAFQNPLQLAVR
jgi:hypothetical protein